MIIIVLTKSERISKNLMSKSPVNADAKLKKIEKKEDDIKEHICICCGKEYRLQKGNFPRNSASPLYASNNGYLPVCRNCMISLFDQFTSFFGQEEKAIERICQLFDLYFSQKCLEASRKISEDRSRISVYISKINIKPHTGKTYSDTIIETRNDTITSMDEVEEIDETDGMDSHHVKKAIKVWGFGFTPEQYMILNNLFDDWKSRVVIDGKTRESLVRELCIIKLQMNVALQDGNTELYTKLVKTFQEVLKSANLEPLQEDVNDKNAEKPIGVMIQMFENERPISKCRPEWEDVDGIVRYITIYFLGHLCKMLNIKNKYSTIYEEEMAKYRVEVPDLVEADDDEVFDYIINGGDENEQNK